MGLAVCILRYILPSTKKHKKLTKVGTERKNKPIQTNVWIGKYINILGAGV